MIYLDNQTPFSELKQYFVSNGWMDYNENIRNIETPGEGNMNVVLRVITNTSSFIIKQSRPFVQKYQQIDAPVDRIDVEYQFYNTVRNNILSAHMPKILGYDASEFVLALEDLGHCEDMSSIYSNRVIADATLRKLVQVLSQIHRSRVPVHFPENLAMRQLNHQHMFVLPFLEDNGFQLDTIQEGLQDLSKTYKTNNALKKSISLIGQQYLSKGNTLLHGDFYPGSWMTKDDQLFVIDPEFGFVGFHEFDLGVMAGHIVIATSNENYVDSIYNLYAEKVDRKLMAQVAGIEIMRRIIGLAQLPLKRTLTEKEYLLEIAKNMIMS